jgi:hypothetical protein
MHMVSLVDGGIEQKRHCAKRGKGRTEQDACREKKSDPCHRTREPRRAEPIAKQRHDFL